VGDGVEVGDAVHGVAPFWGEDANVSDVGLDCGGRDSGQGRENAMVDDEGVCGKRGVGDVSVGGDVVDGGAESRKRCELEGGHCHRWLLSSGLLRLKLTELGYIWV